MNTEAPAGFLSLSLSPQPCGCGSACLWLRTRECVHKSVSMCVETSQSRTEALQATSNDAYKKVNLIWVPLASFALWITWGLKQKIWTLLKSIRFDAGFQLKLCLINQRWPSLCGLIHDQEQTLWIGPSWWHCSVSFTLAFRGILVMEQTLGDGEGQGGLAYCRPWGHEESDTTERLNDNHSNGKEHQSFHPICPSSYKEKLKARHT